MIFVSKEEIGMEKVATAPISLNSRSLPHHPGRIIVAFLEENFEQCVAIVLAFIAALLAITDLAAGKYGSEEIKLVNEKTSDYLWYQSKGIKESLVEGQRDMLQVLLST